jgi:plastocyanin
VKKIIAIIVAAVIIVGGTVALTHKSNPPQSNSSSSSQNSSSSSQDQNSSTGSITIKNMMFTPSQITVAKGGTVTWTNNDNTTHTVVDDLSNVGGPKSGDIAPGTTYSFTFTKTGSFQYHCSIHPSMRGTIVVK